MPILNNDNFNIYYEVHGKGIPLVLIHGLGSSTRDWERQVIFLSRHFKVITADVRGHGKSDKPSGPYSVKLFALDIANLIKNLNLGRVHIAGISMGGMISFQLACNHPELVKTLTIINSGPELILHTFAQRMIFLQRKIIIKYLGMKQMGKKLAKHLLPLPHQKPLQKTLIKRWAENDKKAYLESLNAIIGWTITDRISSIKCPVLIISADMDYLPVSYKKQYMAKLHNAKLIVIYNSRHLSPVDQPVQINNAIMQILCF